MEASALGSRGQEDADGVMVFIDGWWEALPFAVPVAVATQCRQIVCDTFDAARIGPVRRGEPVVLIRRGGVALLDHVDGGVGGAHRQHRPEGER